MSTNRTQVLWLVGAVAAVGLLASPALAQFDCAWYAKTSVRQQQINLENKCGFTGVSWHTDLARHLKWCQEVAPDVWKAEAKKRNDQIETCQKKP